MKKTFKAIFGVLCAMVLALALTCCAPKENEKNILLDKTEVTLTVGESVVLTATLEPEDSSVTVEWNSEDEEVATVENGTVTAVAVGSTTITATAGDKTAQCTVTVQEAVVAVERVELSATTLSLKTGETSQLTASVFPENASNKEVKWTTTDASIATVENGTVTAVAAGSATITATAGDKTAQCTVTVQEAVVAVERVELSATTLSLKTGETSQLTASVFPENASNKEVKWTTTDASVATVENGMVKAVAAGSATITATAGDKTAQCTVTVEWASRYEEFNAIANKAYAKATVTITTKGKDDTLTDVYEVTKLTDGYKVTFTKQRLATIGTDENGNLVLPAERVITETGEREYDANWHETKRSGSNAEISVNTLSLSGYTFKEEYFEDAQFSDNSFEAKVVDAAKFLGTEFNYSDLSVKAETGEGFSLELNYTGAAGTTSILFNFE